MKKKNFMPVLIIISLIVIILGICGISALIKRYTPSNEVQDLSEYYNITSIEQIAIVFDDELIETQAVFIDGEMYLDYQFVHDNINPRFYWDANENILLYAMPDLLYQASADSTSFVEGKTSIDFGSVVVKPTATSAYVHIDFVEKFSTMTYQYESEPSRLIIRTKFDDITTATVKKDTQIRVLGGIKSAILKEVTKGDSLFILEDYDDWLKVMSDDGIIGYMKTKCVSNQETVTLEHTSKDVTFTHNLRDYEICMAWHQVTHQGANDDIASILSDNDAINVISPTWFYLNDNDGNLASYASTEYVNYCRNNNVEVWALFSNLENPDVDTEAVLTHTSSRQHLVKQIISAAIQYDLDGINLDFEAIDISVGDAYIQFVRELSIVCENNGITLSVDNYVPTDYTAFYNRKEQGNFADYVIIMGYDEHYGGCDTAGSVASIGWVEQGLIDTLESVEANQVILGMPFYTRVWSTTPTDDAGESFEVTSKVYGMRATKTYLSSIGVEYAWDETSGQNYARWVDGNVVNEVWLEDTASCEQRLKLLDTYQIAGASFWKLGFEADEVWDVIIKYIN